MTQDFFKKKRPWSRYKDFILNYYLEPYIPKVATLKRPVVIVDCFAGCGRFGDSEPGSPLIIAEAIRRWRAKEVAITGEFIEADGENYRTLCSTLEPFAGFTACRHGTFEEHLPEIERRARDHTVFLYVDPYTVKSLVFRRMKQVYDHIRNSSASVEILMNYNVATFMRWGLAVLKKRPELPDEATDAEADYQADDPTELLELATLDEIAGGSYWQAIATDDSLNFVEKLDAFGGAYLERMLSSFSYVCSYGVKAKYEHQVPKYLLVYATRHPDGIELMNDAMHNANQQFLGAHFISGWLFDQTPEEEKVDLRPLCDGVEKIVREKGQMTRKKLRTQAICSFFGRYAAKHHNAAVQTLLKQGRLFSSTGKPRINDDVILSHTPFAGQQVIPQNRR